MQDEAAIVLTYVLGKCCEAQIRQTTIPKLEFQAAVCAVSLRTQILREHDVKIDNIYH